MAGTERSALDWTKGISLSILASMIGGVSKLAIRKSWLLQAEANRGCDAFGKRSLSDEKLIVASGEHATTPRDATTTNREPDRLAGFVSTRSKFAPYCLRYAGMFGMSVLNPVCNVVALNYETPSIHAPLAGLTLVWVILGSPLVNNEKPTNRQMVACCFIFVGEMMVAIFGDHTNDVYVSIDDVRTSYQTPSLRFYFVGLTLFSALMAYWIHSSTNSTLRRFAWGCSGGAITGAQNFLKDSLIILKVTRTQQQPLPFVFYLLSALAAGTAFAGLLLLTACMKRYDATYSVASFIGSLVVSASVMAALHYHTFAQLRGPLHAVLYPSGILVLILGVNLLIWSNTDYTKEGSHEEKKLIEFPQSQSEITNARTYILKRHKDLEAAGLVGTQRYTG